MDADRPAEPDVASLFAPVAVEETFDGVLTEARQVLGHLDDPVDAELWGSDLIGALASSATGQASLMNTLTGTLVPAAEAASTPEALALLRVFAAVGSPALRAAAGQAAERLHARDVIDASTARLRLERAINAGECPEQPDQVDDVVAHRALLRARLDLLAAQD